MNVQVHIVNTDAQVHVYTEVQVRVVYTDVHTRNLSYLPKMGTRKNPGKVKVTSVIMTASPTELRLVIKNIGLAPYNKHAYIVWTRDL